jgi:hypothetical protein
MSQPRNNNVAARVPAIKPQEKQFWTQFAESMGLPPPREVPESQLGGYGSGTAMDVYSWFTQNQPTIRKKVSTYGGKTVTEMFAEMWSEYCNNSNARPPAVVYGNYVRATIGDMKGKAAQAAA